MGLTQYCIIRHKYVFVCIYINIFLYIPISHAIKTTCLILCRSLVTKLSLSTRGTVDRTLGHASGPLGCRVKASRDWTHSSVPHNPEPLEVVSMLWALCCGLRAIPAHIFLLYVGIRFSTTHQPHVQGLSSTMGSFYKRATSARLVVLFQNHIIRLRYRFFFSF